MNKHTLLQALKDTGIVAVIRAEKADDLLDVTRALCDGGVKLIEFTLTVPGALDVIEQATGNLAGQDVFIGAGTVLDAESARSVILAGASFVVGPSVDRGMIETCNRYGVAAIPGAFTPTEIVQAWQCGAAVVKVFPAGVGGPKYIRDLRGPLPQIDLLPTGGVNLQTAGPFIEAGAVAVGVGGELVGKDLIRRRDFAAITDNARQFVQVVRQARGEKTK